MITRRLAVLVVLAIAPFHSAVYADVAPPSVPANLHVPAGHRPYLLGLASGTQNYICLPSSTGVAWTLFGPQATLFDADGSQLITHFLSPNPDENGALRATWQHAGDTSSVWAVVVQPSSDPNFVAPGAIPWLLLQVVGRELGPASGDKLVNTTYIQRVHTAGGVAPATGCAVSTDVGRRVFVPYTTDYVFYRD